jgi:DNA polymerase III epsilon subunit family exonuclease
MKLRTVSEIGLAYKPFHDMVVFDLETTGLSSRNDDIIQIAAMRIIDGEIQTNDFFSSYVKPSRPISPFISSYTGITNNDVRNAPLPKEIFPEFSGFCKDSLLVAHNGLRFDIPFVLRTCERYGIKTRDSHFIDSIHLSWNLWGRKSVSSHNLDSVIERLRLSRHGFKRHDARGDVSLTAKCVCDMMGKLCKKPGVELSVYQCALPA